MDHELIISAGSATAGISRNGATVTRFSVGGRDVVFPDGMLPVEGLPKRRGGIPLLFPNAGPLPPGSAYALPQHGFARNEEWGVAERLPSRVRLELPAKAPRPEFPFAVDLAIELEVEPGILHEKLTVHNRGEKPFPIAPGFHPYFAVSYAHRAELETNLPDFSAGDFDWASTLFMDGINPVQLKLPNGLAITMHSSDSFKTTAVWSENKRDFLCIEPWIGGEGALLDPSTAVTVRPGGSASFSLHLRAE